MANYLESFLLAGVQRGHDIPCNMPKRARVVAVTATVQGVVILFAHVGHDADTRAFGRHYERTFRVLQPGDEVPDQGQFVGLAQYQKPTKQPSYLLVYEVPGVRGSR